MSDPRLIGGVSSIHGHSREIVSTAATSPVPTKLDELRQKYQQGPCWDATDDSELGALCLYSERANMFDAHIEEISRALAAHAAVAFSGARRSEQFRNALASRDIGGQAKGIVMERYKINAVAAFALLLRLSQNTNTSLHGIARRLINADHPPDQGDGTSN